MQVYVFSFITSRRPINRKSSHSAIRQCPPGVFIASILPALICVCIFTGASPSISAAYPCLDLFLFIYIYVLFQSTAEHT